MREYAGGGLCGAVRCRALGAPRFALICHLDAPERFAPTQVMFVRNRAPWARCPLTLEGHHTR